MELIDGLESGQVKAVWIIATNPAVSLPFLKRFQRALKKADLIICQDAYHPTETTQTAHILLPAAQWIEREGTITNSERRVSLLEKITSSPGEALADWEIICRFAKVYGQGEHFSYHTSEEVFEEYKKTTQGTRLDLSGISYQRLRKGPLQWPCPTPNSPSTPRLFTNRIFPTEDGRARLHAWEYVPPKELPDTEYPFILTTGRVRDQWHTMTRTGKIPSLLRTEPGPFLEIHPEDGFALGIKEGEMVEVISRRGSFKVVCRMTPAIRRGCCFIPFHWGSLWSEAVANEATVDAYDAISKQPELKFCAVRLEPIKIKEE